MKIIFPVICISRMTEKSENGVSPSQKKHFKKSKKKYPLKNQLFKIKIYTNPIG